MLDAVLLADPIEDMVESVAITGRLVNWMPLSVSTVEGTAAMRSRRNYAAIILPALRWSLAKANFDVRSMAKNR